MTMRIALASDASAVMNIVNTGYAQLRALANSPYTAQNLPDWTLLRAQNEIANPATVLAVSVSGATVLGVIQGWLIGVVFDHVQYDNTLQVINWFVLPDSTQAKTRTRFRAVSKEMLTHSLNRAQTLKASWHWGRMPSTSPALMDEFVNNLLTARPQMIADRTSEPGWLLFRSSPADGLLGVAGVV